MSDAGRKPISTKLSESLTPDSQKTTTEKVKESVTGQADKFAAAVQPQQEKSFAQTVSDDVQRGHDQGKEAATPQKPLTETIGEYVEAGKEVIAEAAAYVTGATTGAAEGAKQGADATKTSPYVDDTRK
ncbi:uncharacterized protein KQ657_000997 [Scheffersomyces spartinae]|uniref:Uncharacterized protein n=1 Tax=Scheffersomyces spartinae TaxID=45513 RepID=A0A9P7V8Y4_9ASCO|nr:uncharacterized protein KQ657_000997 [Scheffersomyces spartinae]KAG7193235.1 hypothetical protein KQ657_000997 [Scheffersomyces spartinae]